MTQNIDSNNTILNSAYSFMVCGYNITHPIPMPERKGMLTWTISVTRYYSTMNTLMLRVCIPVGEIMIRVPVSLCISKRDKFNARLENVPF